MFHLRCTGHIYRRVDCYHARETKRNLWSIYMYTKKWRARCSERRDRRLSLFGGLCSQTVPPSNYVYIVLSARIDASPALGCLHGLSSTPRCRGVDERPEFVYPLPFAIRARMAKGKGYTNSAHAHTYDVHPPDDTYMYIHIIWRAGASQPSRTTGTIFL